MNVLVLHFIMLHILSRCQQSYSSRSLDAYSTLLSDVVHTISPELLGALLHEELTEQRDRLMFCEGATGGALAFVPFSQSGSSSQHGCLLYPGNQGMDCLSIQLHLPYLVGTCIMSTPTKKSLGAMT